MATWLLLLALPAVVQAQFTFATTNNAITITGYTGTNGTVVIPSTINGYPVTTIGSQAFFSCTSLASVSISDGINSIESEAFTSCYSLTNVMIPDQPHERLLLFQRPAVDELSRPLLPHPLAMNATGRGWNTS